MKKSIFKSLMLVLVALVTAIPSQAQTSIYERGNTTEWSNADLSDWTASYCTPTINGGLNVSTTNSGWTVTKAIAVTENSKVTLNATLKTGGATGRSGSYDYIQMGGVSLRFYEQDYKASVDVDGTESNISITYTRANSYEVTIIIDQAEGNVSYSIGSATGTATSSTAITNVVFGHYKAGRENYTINPVLQKIKVEEVTNSGTYYSYSVNAVDGENNVLKVIKSGNVESEANQIHVDYPQHVLVGTNLMETAKGSSYWYSLDLTIDQNKYVYNIPYTNGTVENVVFYTEGEDVEGATLATNPARASCGAMGYTGSSYINATTLGSGTYKIFMRGVNGNSTARAVSFKVGEKEVFATSITSGTNYLANSDVFEVSEQSQLSFSCEGSSASGIDWFYVVRVPRTLNYTVNAVDGEGNVLQVIETGLYEEGTELSIYYPQNVLSNNTLYVVPQGPNSPGWYVSQITPNVDGYVYNIAYTKETVENVVYYTEAEDVEGCNTANNLVRASKGHMGHTGGAYVDVTTLQPGKYKIYIRGLNGNSSSRAVSFKMGATEVLSTSITNGTNYLANSDEFVVDEAATLSFSCEGSSLSGLDWFYIVRTGVEVTISQYGYSTLYYGDCNLAVPEGLTANVVTIDGNKATLTDIGSVIPAGTGVVLEGTPSTIYTLAATNEKGLTAENDLKGTDITTEINEEGYKYYMLSVKGGDAKTIGFYFQVAGGESITNNSHCAYLAVPAENTTPANSYIFFDQTDGMSAVSIDKLNTNDAYTLTGVRVDGSRLQKGVYVINGKKTIIK